MHGMHDPAMHARLTPPIVQAHVQSAPTLVKASVDLCAENTTQLELAATMVRYYTTYGTCGLAFAQLCPETTIANVAAAAAAVVAAVATAAGAAAYLRTPLALRNLGP